MESTIIIIIIMGIGLPSPIRLPTLNVTRGNKFRLVCCYMGFVVLYLVMCLLILLFLSAS